MTIGDEMMRYFITGISYIIGIILGVSGILCIAGAIKSNAAEMIIGTFAGIGFIGISFYIFKPEN